MDDLPDLPFEKVLSYLGLKELLEARTVSRAWYKRIDNFRVRSLCFSEWERDYIKNRHHLIVDEFAQNFISSTKLKSRILAHRCSATCGVFVFMS